MREIDGHDQAAIARAIHYERGTPRPSLIACRTTIGYGAPTRAGTAKAHGEPLGACEIAGARAALGWEHPPFEVPAPILASWREAGRRGAAARRAWDDQVAAAGEAGKAFRRQLDRDPAPNIDGAIAAMKTKLVAEQPKLATRQASQKVLEALLPAEPRLVGGSADLTGSNGTRVSGQTAIAPHEFAGSYIHFGVREHAMAAVMNGIALHGGFIPYGGTFLAFSDYARPAMRLSALMGLSVVHVMTHDSIGLGEDGPTHQPVEHLTALRAIPNLLVFRPADAIETAEAWQCALQQPRTPSVLSLTRQTVPALRTEARTENLTVRGGYLISESWRAARRHAYGDGLGSVDRMRCRRGARRRWYEGCGRLTSLFRALPEAGARLSARRAWRCSARCC